MIETLYCNKCQCYAKYGAELNAAVAARWQRVIGNVHKLHHLDCRAVTANTG